MVTGALKAKRLLHAAAMLLLCAPPIRAGTGPGHLGLPVAQAYGNSYDNNQISSMCVDCHTENPSAHTAEASDGTVNDPVYRGTHFVYRAGKTTNNTGWEKLDQWGVNSSPDFTGGYSKYGNPGTGVSETGVAGEMICESCHNVVINAPGSTAIPPGKGNRKLLAWVSEQTTTGILCEGCHGTASGFDPSKFNHRTGDIKTTTGTVLSTADSPTTRDVPLVGSGVVYPAADSVSCRSCHVTHDGITGAGARGMKRGYSKDASALGDPVQGVSTTGLDRQYDIDAAVPPTNRLVTNSSPLCDSCHKFND